MLLQFMCSIYAYTNVLAWINGNYANNTSQPYNYLNATIDIMIAKMKSVIYIGRPISWTILSTISVGQFNINYVGI